ncbi:protein CURVATURE THYLAKOID 1A, chloroplastic-like isoform X1 [Aristolochia californica]|uniref:protein CURVATURE THYLAKOID 1A, chloroplastic-like isoform X1 n=1 Tax=Aristolochia californica TaxID=171875 RepID=UPI0035E18F0C
MATAYAGASVAAVLGARLPSSSPSRLPYLPPRHLFSVSSSPLSTSQFSGAVVFPLSESRRSSSLRVRATEETSGSVQVEDLFSDLKEKWDGLENKSTVIVYGGGAIVAVWLSSIVVGAVNSVPLLPKILELVGLGYSGWFVYRYLLFKQSRKELASDIEALKKKVAGTGD